MHPKDPERTLGDSPETIPLVQAARRLGIGAKAARRAAVSGQLAAVKINGRWRVIAAALEELLRP